MNLAALVLSGLRILGTIMLAAVPVTLIWNGALVEAISVVKPITYFQAIGLQILAMLMQQSLNFYYIRGQEGPQGEIK